MTNREALEVIERLGVDSRGYPKLKEAIDMAIEALNFVSEHHQSNIETYAHDMGVSLEQAERELQVEELSCSEEPNRSEPLTDKEQRIFLAAMGREREVCKQVDDEWRDCREPYEDSLVSVCNEIERKVKGALWDGN